MAIEQLLGVEDFARSYIKDIDHHEGVHTEHLAESLRNFFGLPPFPTLLDLSRLCQRLGIPVNKLPPVPGLDGLNTWSKATGPEIYVSDDLKVMRRETTICHEVREVLENAFKRTKASYIGLNTSDNNKMNPESDHFAGCLLMQADATRSLLRSLGFDLPRFSRETGRSLPSVVLRLQSLYSAGSGEKTPVAGIWLFDSPWGLVETGGVTSDLMCVKHLARLCGFSLKKGGPPQVMLARGIFPARGSKLAEFGFGRIALEERGPLMAEVRGFDMFGEHDYRVVAEPIFSRGNPWRVLVVGAREDGVDRFGGWLLRLQIQSVFRTFQAAEPEAAARN